MNEEKKAKFNLLLFLQSYFQIAITVVFTFQLTIFLVSYIFKVSNLWIGIGLFVTFFLVYAISKDEASEGQAKYGTILLKASILVVLYSLVSHIFITLGDNLTKEKASSLLQLSVLINIGLSIGLLVWLRKPETKEIFSNLQENSLLEKLGIVNAVVEKKTGDIKIAINKETGKDEILPFKDRFLHMLILGPTGSGKTSQMIIPMILQDIQNYEAGITVIEPKSDLAEKVYAMAKHYGRPVVYFNPILPDCPYFNPLFGNEADVIENMATTFKMLNPDSPQFFLDMNDVLIRNALKVIKRSMNNDGTLIDLHHLVSNPGGAGRKTVQAFSRMKADSTEMAKENADISSYFLNDYYNEKSKTYEHCSGIRSQVSKITSNEYLRRVLNPPQGRNDIDFDKHLEEGGVIAIATAQGKLRDLGRYLGYFIILQFQASVFRRPGNENNRRAHFLYIDEFQVYANPGFSDMLTQGRSYRVASHLATQNRALMGMGRGQEGKDFIEVVSTNARNIVIYPGGNSLDAKYYSQQFGDVLNKTVQKGISRAKFNPLHGIPKSGQATESIREVETIEARFSPSDIMYRPNGEITYLLIKKNSIQTPQIGTIEYIPVDLNEKLDRMIEEYESTIFKKPIGDKLDNTTIMDTEIVDEAYLSKNPIIQEDTKYRPNDRREYLTKDEEFTDDIVISGGKTPMAMDEQHDSRDGERSTPFNFLNDDEDDIL